MNLCTYPNPAITSHFFPAFEHIDEAFFFFNPHFGVEYLNHQAKLLAKKMYGKIPRTGDNILGFISAGRRQAFQNVFEQVLNDKQIQYEVQVEDTSIWLYCKYFSSKDETGRITGVYGLLRDISTEKALNRLEEKPA